MQHIHSKQEFKEALEANPRVIVDFFATWCGPCKMLSPILEQIDKENEDVEVLKIDTDEVSELAEEFRIMSIPTVYYFKDGKQVAVEIGFRGKADILENVNKYLR